MSHKPAFLTRYSASFSFVGLVFAGLFFAGSLSPSLLPRHYTVQGLLAGFSLAVGYGLGVFWVWLWNYLEIPVPRAQLQLVGKWISVLGVTILTTIFLWRAAVWQNSILPSWITILVDPQRARVSAQHLFETVYAHWRSLPAESRPQLYLHGLSLGSLGSETSAELVTIFEDPIQGAVWSGPPFPSTHWSAITRARNPDSPAWLPTYRNGRMLRFTGQENALTRSTAGWGPLRLVYLQHASDPMVFFSPSLLLERPQWLVGPRGPDVSPYLEVPARRRVVSLWFLVRRYARND